MAQVDSTRRNAFYYFVHVWNYPLSVGSESAITRRMYAAGTPHLQCSLMAADGPPGVLRSIIALK